MDVSIIIVNYKTSGLVINCINSIHQHTHGINYEVIIVDNNSEPDFEKKILQGVIKKERDLHFLSLPENIGFGRANNKALKIAQGRNIFFLNPDTVLLNNAVKILSDFLDHHSNVGACGGNLYEENLRPTISFSHVFPGFFEYLDALFKYKLSYLKYNPNINFNHQEKPLKVGFIIGADLMVKRSVLVSVGSFSDDFFMFYEETDLCYRIKKSGLEIYSVPQAKIQHLESQSFDKKSFPEDKRIAFSETSRNLFLRKHHNPIYIRVSNAFYKMFLTSRILLTSNPDKKDYYRRRKNFYKSTK